MKKSDFDDELSLSKIDDYDNKESKNKRNTVIKVILIGLAVGAVIAMFKYNYNQVDDYVGTKDNPGIDTTKKY